MTKPAVLVTGGAGYIGSHAVLALKDAGWHVAVIDDLSNGSREVVPEDVPFYLAMNCGYGKGLSVLEVLDAVDRLTNEPVKRVIEGRRAGDPPELVADNAWLLETLDWRPAYADIDRIVGDALSWERKLAERAA